MNLTLNTYTQYWKTDLLNEFLIKADIMRNMK